MHDGTAEPLRVSPPEAVAYLLELQQPQLLTDDISVQELTELVVASGSFGWLNAPEEDIYSLADGEAVQWPSP